MIAPVVLITLVEVCAGFGQGSKSKLSDKFLTHSTPPTRNTATYHTYVDLEKVCSTTDSFPTLSAAIQVKDLLWNSGWKNKELSSPTLSNNTDDDMYQLEDSEDELEVQDTVFPYFPAENHQQQPNEVEKAGKLLYLTEMEDSAEVTKEMKNYEKSGYLSWGPFESTPTVNKSNNTSITMVPLSTTEKIFETDPTGELQISDEKENEKSSLTITLAPPSTPESHATKRRSSYPGKPWKAALRSSNIRVKRQHWSKTRNEELGQFAQDTANFRREFAKHRFSPNLVRNMSPIFMRRLPKSLSADLGVEQNYPRRRQSLSPSELTLSAFQRADAGERISSNEEPFQSNHHPQNTDNASPEAPQDSGPPPEHLSSGEAPLSSQEQPEANPPPPPQRSQEQVQSSEAEPPSSNEYQKEAPSGEQDDTYMKLPRGRAGDPQKLLETRLLREEQRKVLKKLKLRKLPLITNIPKRSTSSSRTWSRKFEK